MKKIVINHEKEELQVLTTLLEEMESSQEFILSVAFLSLQGIQLIKTALYNLHQRGISGRLLTGIMGEFNQQSAFIELLKIPNLEAKVLEKENLHQKIYLFKREENHWHLLSGSSNLTENALKTNHEFNTLVEFDERDETFLETKEYFEHLWEEATDLSQQWIDNYRPLAKVTILKKEYDRLRGKKEIFGESKHTNYHSIHPNSMQNKALKGLKELREKGETRALIISATGTGKTFLSAFDVAKVNPKRCLFLAHRETLLTQAAETYKKVVENKTFGIVSGNRKELSKDYLFGTVQTVSQNLNWFRPDAFEYIIIDESHHSAGSMYQAILQYFQPKFLLGMTATPERMDDYDIFDLFHHNVAFEIRLQDALEENLLVPFHYFGVEEHLVDETRDVKLLVTDLRVAHIKKKIEYYCPTDEVPRGIVFASSVDEAKELAKRFTEMGLPSKALHSQSNIYERELVVRDLEDGKIQYIFVKDLFNEGIDIPSVNRIILLRQTESSIVFIQQLGRGLRKFEGKEATTVLDFIGNYTNNYMIPLALTGDQSGNKENLKIPKYSTKFNVAMEEIPRQRIYASIQSANINSAKALKDSFQYLKAKLGRVPKLSEFIPNNQKDPYTIGLYKKEYVSFLEWMREIGDSPVSPWEKQVLHFLTKQVMKGVKQEEIHILEELMASESIDFSKPTKAMMTAFRILSLEFFGTQDKTSYGNVSLVERVNERLHFSIEMKEALRNVFFREQVIDVLETAKQRNLQYRNANQLVIGKMYSYTDVCRLLDWESDERATIGGYRTKFGTTPIFVNLDKEKEAIQYSDKLLSREEFFWHSRKQRTIKSNEIQQILDPQNTTHLFVRRKDANGTKDFIYLGKVIPKEARNSKLEEQDIVEMIFDFEQPVEHKTYEYLVSDLG